jgi:hypothetical protein
MAGSNAIGRWGYARRWSSGATERNEGRRPPHRLIEAIMFFKSFCTHHGLAIELVPGYASVSNRLYADPVSSDEDR